VVLVFTNSCINPFIYAAKYREFQHGVRRLASVLGVRPRQTHPEHGATGGSFRLSTNAVTQQWEDTATFARDYVVMISTVAVIAIIFIDHFSSTGTAVGPVRVSVCIDSNFWIK